MISAFMLDNYPRMLVEVLLFMAQVPERHQTYEVSKVGTSLTRKFWWSLSFLLNGLGVKFM